MIPMQGWYAPSLTSPLEAGVADRDTRHVLELLKTGVAPRGSAMGPMEVPANLIRVVLSGGYLPATAGNPRPYGMPPFSPGAGRRAGGRRAVVHPRVVR